MEFKGTKGKWNQNNHSVFIGEEEQVGVNVICRLHTGAKPYMGREQKANALLISKAPEMLNLLNEILISIDYEEIANQTEYYKSKILELLKEATNI